ncbi:MAG: hypothetical protein WEB06_05990 [Actinomycetota bacterium]
MSERDTLGVEIGTAIGILGLLLVFLPLFVQAAARAGGGHESAEQRRARTRQAWAVPVLIGVAALDATLGLVTLWDKLDVGSIAGWLLLVLVWHVVALSVWTVKTGLR